MDNEVKLVTATGTPHEMGQTQGEINSESVKRVVAENVQNFHEILKLRSLTYLPYEKYISLA